MTLTTYRKKRNFQKTPEPKGKIAPTKSSGNRFVVQEHHASTLHFDFRLEMGGVLKSWAIPKGPSLDPRQKRLAIEVEDHPVDYIDFKGNIADGNYGAGQVVIWDSGDYELLDDIDPMELYDEGKLSFILHSEKLQGQFNLIKMPSRKKQWLLIKSNDEAAQPDWKLQTILENGAKGKQKGTKKIPARASSRTKATQVVRRAPVAKPKETLVFQMADRQITLENVERASMPEQIEPMLATLVDKREHKAAEEIERTERKEEIKRTERLGKSPKGKSAGPTIPLPQLVEEELEGNLQVAVDNTVVALSHLDKPYWQEEGFAKGDLIKYYVQLSDALLPYLKGRPLILKRYPNGINAPFFFQHDLAKAPDFVHTVSLESEGGRKIDYAIIDNMATLLYLTNLGTIEEHPWHSRIQDIDHPDWMVFDLDPEDAAFGTVCAVALALYEFLARLNVNAFAKTSGSRGMHVFVPIQPRYSYAQITKLAERTAILVARENPKVATVERALTRREPGHVYIDHLQNAKGKTIAAAYSARARAGATVSAPLTWDEVKGKIKPQEFTIKTMPERFREKGNLFEPVIVEKQNLDSAIKQIDEMFKRKK